MPQLTTNRSGRAERSQAAQAASESERIAGYCGNVCIWHSNMAFRRKKTYRRKRATYRRKRAFKKRPMMRRRKRFVRKRSTRAQYKTEYVTMRTVNVGMLDDLTTRDSIAYQIDWSLGAILGNTTMDQEYEQLRVVSATTRWRPQAHIGQNFITGDAQNTGSFINLNNETIPLPASTAATIFNIRSVTQLPYGRKHGLNYAKRTWYPKMMVSNWQALGSAAGSNAIDLGVIRRSDWLSYSGQDAAAPVSFSGLVVMVPYIASVFGPIPPPMPAGAWYPTTGVQNLYQFVTTFKLQYRGKRTSTPAQPALMGEPETPATGFFNSALHYMKDGIMTHKPREEAEKFLASQAGKYAAAAVIDHVTGRGSVKKELHDEL